MEQVCERIKKMNGREPDQIQIMPDFLRYNYIFDETGLRFLYQINNPEGHVIVFKREKDEKFWFDESEMFTFHEFLTIKTDWQ